MSLTPEEKTKRKVERHKKAAAEMKAALVETQQKTLKNAIQETSEINKKLKHIKNNMINFNNIKIDILKDLNYLYDNQDQLKLETDKTFFEIIEELGISKVYYYEQLQAYNLCLEYNNEKVFNEIDTKLLVQVSRVEDKKQQQKYFENVYTLSRSDIKTDSDIKN